MQFVSMTICAGTTLTVGAVLSDGEFLPQLAEPVMAAYEALSVPSVTSQEGLNPKAVLMAWNADEPMPLSPGEPPPPQSNQTELVEPPIKSPPPEATPVPSPELSPSPEPSPEPSLEPS
ncbi:MAG: hypothetical protein RSD32_01595, partial [Oscillospiraceae bacterium]